MFYTLNILFSYQLYANGKYSGVSVKNNQQPAHSRMLKE